MIVAEMFDSALEAAVDLSTRESSELARTAKDIAAGAVLVSAIGSLVIAFLILGPRIAGIWMGHYSIPSHTAANIAVLAVIMIMLMVILIKTHFGRGFPTAVFPAATAPLLFRCGLRFFMLPPIPGSSLADFWLRCWWLPTGCA